MIPPAGAPNTTCETCKHVFFPEAHEHYTEEGGVRLSFTCPKCFRNYPVAVITAKGLEIRKKMQARRTQRRKIPAAMVRRFKPECRRSVDPTRAA